MTTIVHDLRDTLEGKEIEIYRLLCENLKNSEIAERMCMPKPTVEWHLKNIYRKLGVEMKTGEGNGQAARRRAMMYAGTRIEQVVNYENKTEKSFSVREIRTAAKKTGCSLEQTADLVSFLEMES
jgi:DNA-binding NarL/FixJ family response regulator